MQRSFWLLPIPYVNNTGQLLGVPQTTLGMVQNIFPFGTTQVCIFYWNEFLWVLCSCFFICILCGDARGLLYVTAFSSPDASPGYDSAGGSINIMYFVYRDMYWLLIVIRILFASLALVQATRHARRVYVGGLPPMTNEQVFLWVLLFWFFPWQ